MPRGQLRDEERRDRRRVGERLVVEFGQLMQQRSRIGCDEFFVMLRAEVLGNRASVRQFVEGGFVGVCPEILAVLSFCGVAS